MINNASILHARPTMFPNFVSVYSFYLIILRKTKNMGLRWHWLWVLPQILKDPLSASKERNYITPIWFSVNTRMDLFTIILFPKLSIVQKGIQSYSVFYMIFVVMQLLMYGIQTTDAAHVSINCSVCKLAICEHDCTYFDIVPLIFHFIWMWNDCRHAVVLA